MRRATLGLLSLLLVACSVFEPEHAGLVLRFREVDPLVRERLVVRVTDGGTEWYLEGTDMEAEADGWFASRELRTRPGGEATISVAFRGEGSQPASTGEVTLDMPADARWRVDIFPSALEASVACGGCDGVARFPILPRFRSSAQDWLYLRWTRTASDPSAGLASARTSNPTQELR